MTPGLPSCDRWSLGQVLSGSGAGHFPCPPQLPGSYMLTSSPSFMAPGLTHAHLLGYLGKDGAVCPRVAGVFLQVICAHPAAHHARVCVHPFLLPVVRVEIRVIVGVPGGDMGPRSFGSWSAQGSDCGCPVHRGQTEHRFLKLELPGQPGRPRARPPASPALGGSRLRR